MYVRTYVCLYSRMYTLRCSQLQVTTCGSLISTAAEVLAYRNNHFLFPQYDNFESESKTCSFYGSHGACLQKYLFSVAHIVNRILWLVFTHTHTLTHTRTHTCTWADALSARIVKQTAARLQKRTHTLLGAHGTRVKKSFLGKKGSKRRSTRGGRDWYAPLRILFVTCIAYMRTRNVHRAGLIYKCCNTLKFTQKLEPRTYRCCY